MKLQETRSITASQAHEYEVLQPLLSALYDEFQELSKKKPQEPVSKGKVKVVNRVLEPVIDLLDAEPQRKFLDALDDDDLPQNSDVVLMLGQALTAMQSFRSRYYHGLAGWRVGDDTEDEQE